ncbi:MAG: hypothetical protein LBI60_04320, partial [Bacteroidales bacterium]|nr:hypothetical protein [Bacteroidales bacterium]
MKHYFFTLVCFASILFAEAKENVSFEENENDFTGFFTYTIENVNNVILTWGISPGEELPEYYELMLLGRYTLTINKTKDTFIFPDMNLSPGEYIYHLVAHYEDRIVWKEFTVQILNYAIPEWISHVPRENPDGALIRWNFPFADEYPEYCQLERNGEIIITLPQEQIYYEDTFFEKGVYTYRLIAYYADGQTFTTNDYELEIGDLENALPTDFISIVNKNHVGLLWTTTDGERKPKYY